MRKIILDPYPRKKEEIFVASSLKNLNSKYKIIEFDGKDRLDFYNMHIEEVSYIIGQPKLDEELLKKAKKLKAVLMLRVIFYQILTTKLAIERALKYLLHLRFLHFQ